MRKRLATADLGARQRWSGTGWFVRETGVAMEVFLFAARWAPKETRVFAASLRGSERRLGSPWLASKPLALEYGGGGFRRCSGNHEPS
jgi:hypothetical protein